MFDTPILIAEARVDLKLTVQLIWKDARRAVSRSGA
jgi:hypothetical protein